MRSSMPTPKSRLLRHGLENADSVHRQGARRRHGYHHGLMYRPSRIDPSRTYPIIDNIYPGPQVRADRQPFLLVGASWHEQPALAELGFFVIGSLDALGTPFRSKAFHEQLLRRNMTDNGIADHVAAIKQLAARNPQIDVTNVGIYGHSGGGFSSTDAILRFPDFFKVAVSGAGNHDNRSYDYTWGEKYQGIGHAHRHAGTDNFDSQANWRLAENLKGHLLLMYGTMDDNVSPVNTQAPHRGALIKANKDFDSLELPNRNHGFASEPYAIRRTWDCFVTTSPRRRAAARGGLCCGRRRRSPGRVRVSRVALVVRVAGPNEKRTLARLYCSRRTSNARGSTVPARHAGTNAAATPISSSSVADATNDSGSIALTPKKEGRQQSS